MPSFIELQGDRVHGDDPALISGLGSLDGVPLVIIGLVLVVRRARSSRSTAAGRPT